MRYDRERVKATAERREWTEIELKKSKDALARSVYSSICAFLNRRGGHVIDIKRGVPKPAYPQGNVQLISCHVHNLQGHYGGRELEHTLSQRFGKTE